jgi:3-(3-hydroxy-phenyl)propionate hydroxylase
VIRKAAGIEFPGWDPTTSWMIAEVEMTEDTPRGIRLERGGVQALHRMEDGRTVRAVLTDPEVVDNPEPTLHDLRASLVAVYGTDFGAQRPKWISRFTDMTRQAASYRRGRVLLAGDAAHVHPPQGGQGLNTSVQDAVNLGWKLAQVVHGTSPEALLDTYHAERHPVAARVLRNTMAQVAVSRTDERSEALRDTVAELLGLDEARQLIGGMLSGLDIHYDLGAGHPLLGRRMPDLDLVSADGPLRVFSLLHTARPVLLHLAGPGDFDVTPWGARVQFVTATYSGAWELPVLGEVAAPAAVLIRPDGHVAWVGSLGDPELPGALTVWFGPPQQP